MEKVVGLIALLIVEEDADDEIENEGREASSYRLLDKLQHRFRCRQDASVLLCYPISVRPLLLERSASWRLVQRQALSIDVTLDSKESVC